MIRFARWALVAVLGLPLAGCGVPDLVAHAVKEVEKSRNAGQGDAAASPAPVSTGMSQPQQDEPPPPMAQPAPRRSSVTVEELPPR